jgi:hypothetical protein
MRPGTHIKTQRTGFTHHGIYIGEGRVIHYAGLSDGFVKSGPICEVSLEEFQCGKGFKEVAYGTRFSDEEIVCRAKSRLGEAGYNVFHNNCEHFCAWCVTGDHASKQIDVGTVAASSGFGAVAAGAGVGAVTTAGTMAGLSGGAGIMGGLATVGGVVGGGAVAGVAVLAAGPALIASAITNNTVFADSAHLEKSERDARAAARTATVAGSVAGTAASVGTIAAAGTVSGLSAAGITSGLAAIGGTVGGGMLVGVGLTVGLPVVAAGLIGFGAYKLFQKK